MAKRYFFMNGSALNVTTPVQGGAIRGEPDFGVMVRASTPCRECGGSIYGIPCLATCETCLGHGIVIDIDSATTTARDAGKDGQ